MSANKPKKRGGLIETSRWAPKERTLALSLGLQGTGVSPAPITPHSTQLGPGREVGGDALVHTPDSIAKLSEPHYNVQIRKGKRSRNGNNIIY